MAVALGLPCLPVESKGGGAGNEKEVYKEPIKSLFETTKNVKKEMKAHK